MDENDRTETKENQPRPKEEHRRIFMSNLIKQETDFDLASMGVLRYNHNTLNTEN